MTILAVAVGNTRTRVALCAGKDLHEPRALPNDTPDALIGAIESLTGEHPDARVVIASVNAPIADRIESALARSEVAPPLRIGRDLPLDIPVALPDPAGVGQDRLLNALGAYATAEQACIVIDAGTAITVDFVDGQGTFQGGAIAPGLRMMLRAMHEGTDALPAIGFEPLGPSFPTFGKSTAEAMRLGVHAAACGMVQHLTERYAEAYGAYPQIIATGGDAPALFEHSELVEHVVPDLQLMGIREACLRAIRAEADDDDDDD